MPDQPSALRSQVLVRKRTVAIIFGAQSWPAAPNLQGGKPFLQSATDIRDYLRNSNDGLGLSKLDILWLFNRAESGPQQIDIIEKFLEDCSLRIEKSEGAPLSDVVVYFVGHGSFPED